MAADLLLVFDRISLMSNTAFFEGPSSLRQFTIAKPSKSVYLKDDPAFEVETNFVPEWGDPYSKPSEVELLQNFKEIQNMDANLHRLLLPLGSKDPDSEKKAENDQSDALKNAENVSLAWEDMEDLDFGFDEDGNMVSLAKGRNDAQNIPGKLEDLNLEEDFTAVAGIVEDLSKSMQSVSNDPNYATTLNQSEATVVVTEKRIRSPKRRKISIDYVTTIGVAKDGNRSLMGHVSLKQPMSNLQEIIASSSRYRPQFINLCYRLILGSLVTENIPLEALPLALRHPATSNLESYLQEIDDIERGRNANVRRPSLSFIEDIFLQGAEDGSDAFRELNFTFDPLIPMDEDDEVNENENENENSLDYRNRESKEKLANFKQFLRDRVCQVSERLVQEQKRITFENLIPSKKSVNEDLVTVRNAARSFAYLLQLASENVILLSTDNEGKFDLERQINICFV